MSFGTSHIDPAGHANALQDEKSKARLQKAVKDFESLFVGYMLKSMRATIQKGDKSEDGFGGDMLESMFDVELAKHVSQNSNLGLAEILYRGMTGEKLPSAPPRTAATPRHEAPELVKVVPATPAPAAGKPTVAVSDAPAVPVPAHAFDKKTGKIMNAGALDRRLAQFEPMIREASEKHNVDANLLKAVMASESAGNPLARSPKNAKGLMQLIDSTAADMGVRNVWNPRDNILGGAKYLEQLLKQFSGNIEQAVASYNAGPGAVQKHGGIPPYRETQQYVSRVMNFLQYFEQQEGSSNDEE